MTPLEYKTKVETLLSTISESEWNLGKGLVQLGNTLFEIRRGKVWKEWGHESFGAYIDTIREKIDKSRSHLYSAISVAEKLLPSVEESVLEEMGIGKASALAKHVKNTGQPPSDELVEKARDPKTTIKELRAELHQEIHPDDKGVFWDLKGFFVTEDERDVLLRAFKVAETTDPAIPKETSDSMRRKEIFMRFAMEYLSQYEGKDEPQPSNG